MSQPIRYLDTAVQAALLADRPQEAVTALIKRYAAQMAGDILALHVFRREVDFLRLEDVLAVLEEWGAA